MKFSTVLLSEVLLATAVLAAPRGNLAARVARRAEKPTSTRQGQPIKRVDGPGVSSTDNITEVEYSSNWSGAVLTSPPSASATYSAVYGTFNVPTPSVPSGSSSGGRGGNTDYAASAWVGIDGDTYDNAILQAGVDFTVSSSGSVSYDAWYEWYPDYAYDFDNFDISSGDEIKVSIVSTSSSAGTVTLENLTTGSSVSKTLSAPESDATLGGQNAEWIVEDFEEDDSLVAFADFGTVTFTDAYAVAGGEDIGVEDATIIDIEQDSTVLTSVTIESDSEVVITYV
jgi:hypothetical protein